MEKKFKVIGFLTGFIVIAIMVTWESRVIDLSEKYENQQKELTQGLKAIEQKNNSLRERLNETIAALNTNANILKLLQQKNDSLQQKLDKTIATQENKKEVKIEKTGFCWKCGLPVKTGLFCNKKHQEQYERAEERKIIRGKKAGYGARGSTH